MTSGRWLGQVVHSVAGRLALLKQQICAGIWLPAAFLARDGQYRALVLMSRPGRQILKELLASTCCRWQSMHALPSGQQAGTSGAVQLFLKLTKHAPAHETGGLSS